MREGVGRLLRQKRPIFGRCWTQHNSWTWATLLCVYWAVVRGVGEKNSSAKYVITMCVKRLPWGALIIALPFVSITLPFFKIRYLISLSPLVVHSPSPPLTIGTQENELVM